MGEYTTIRQEPTGVAHTKAVRQSAYSSRGLSWFSPSDGFSTVGMVGPVLEFKDAAASAFELVLLHLDAATPKLLHAMVVAARIRVKSKRLMVVSPCILKSERT